MSMNDCMETGPNLLPNLPAILLMFCHWKIVLTAEIQKAFLQVGVAVYECFFVCFWFS